MEPSNLEVYAATQELVDLFKGNLREADVLEIKRGSGRDPDEALQRSFEVSSRCRVATWKGEPAAVYGVVPYSMLGGRASIWLLGTDKVFEMGASFVRASRVGLLEVVQGLNYVENWVDIENTLSVKWLKWLGFESAEPEPRGPEGHTFQHFWKEF